MPDVSLHKSSDILLLIRWIDMHHPEKSLFFVVICLFVFLNDPSISYAIYAPTTLLCLK